MHLLLYVVGAFQLKKLKLLSVCKNTLKQEYARLAMVFIINLFLFNFQKNNEKFK